MEWLKFLEVLVAFSLPFTADLFKLPIFFKNWKLTYKILSSIFASGLYGYIRFVDPNFIFIPLNLWWLFFAIALLLTIVYISLHTFHKHSTDERKQSAIIIVGLFTFILLYASLTVGFCLLFQSLNYKLVSCKIVDRKTKKPIEDATVTLFFVEDGKTEEYRIGQESDSNGTIARYITDSKLDKLAFFSVTHSDYQNIPPTTAIDKSRLNDLQNIKLSE